MSYTLFQSHTKLVLIKSNSNFTSYYLTLLPSHNFFTFRMFCMNFLLGLGGKFGLYSTDDCLKSCIVIIPPTTNLKRLVILVQVEKDKIRKLHRVVLAHNATSDIGNSIEWDGNLMYQQRQLGQQESSLQSLDPKSWTEHYETHRRFHFPKLWDMNTYHVSFV